MRVFIDTSAFLALLNSKDQNHTSASQIWIRLISEEAFITCTSYVLVESFALIQNRLGIEAVKAFEEDVIPMIQIEWVDRSLHQAGVSALLTANRRKLSLVDCVSFETARQMGIKMVFAFDQHFIEQGFTCLT